MKKIIALVMILMIVFIITGCNRQIIDLNWKYNYAYVELPNGEVVEGAVSSWRDYEDGDQLQVVIDGKTYLSHASRIVLVAQ